MEVCPFMTLLRTLPEDAMVMEYASVSMIEFCKDPDGSIWMVMNEVFGACTVNVSQSCVQWMEIL